MSSAAEFAECCASQRWFVDEGWVEKHVAVDNLQLLAESAGFVDELGEDTVQATMSAAFAPVEALPSAYASQLLMQWELDDPRDRWKWTGEMPPAPSGETIEKPVYRTPQSTIDAFRYVLSLGHADQIAAWLRSHSQDAPALLANLEAV